MEVSRAGPSRFRVGLMHTFSAYDQNVFEINRLEVVPPPGRKCLILKAFLSSRYALREISVPGMIFVNAKKPA